MAADLAPRPFYRDGRGNRLEAWDVTDHTLGHHLWLRGTTEMVGQIKRSAPEYQDAPMSSPAPTHWTHVLYSPVGLRTETRLLLGLLSMVITLPALDNVDGAIVLDWYKNPQEGVDPYSWANSEVGDLVNRGKYRHKFDPEQQAQAGRELVSRVCGVIDMHPCLKAVDVILDIPGHDSTQVSFGSRIAATVARDTQTPSVRVWARDTFRAQAKSMDANQRAEALRNQFYVNESLAGRTVLIVDDVFRSGESMMAAARAAAVAGACAVYGICAVRTMRK